jgi:hypothetical protein
MQPAAGLLLLLLPNCLGLQCYQGLDSEYEVPLTASLPHHHLQASDCRLLCQGGPCLCMKATPAMHQGGPAQFNGQLATGQGGQFQGQGGQFQGQGGQFQGQGGQFQGQEGQFSGQYPSRQGEGVKYRGVDGKEYQYYPVPSGRAGPAGARGEARLPTYSGQWEAAR